MDITIKIPDEFVIEVAKDFGGLQYPPDQVHPLEEHVAAIESKFYELLDHHYKLIVSKDADVINKETELKSLIESKLAATKEEKGK